MEKLVEYAWTIISAIFWFFLSRLTNKIDDLEKGKADGDALAHQAKLIHELDRRVDELGHTTINRSEFKQDVTALHIRANELEKRKADRISQIKVVDDKKGK